MELRYHFTGTYDTISQESLSQYHQGKCLVYIAAPKTSVREIILIGLKLHKSRLQQTRFRIVINR